MATQEERLVSLAGAIGDDVQSILLTILGVGGSLATLKTADKTSIVSALNTLYDMVVAAGSGLAIDDADADGSTSAVYSSEKVLALIAAARAAAANDAIAQITDTAPDLLNTLNELAAALGDDPNFATTVNNALAKRLRVDGAQAFTEPEKVQGRSNLGVLAASAIGNPDRDLVAVYTSAKTT